MTAGSGQPPPPPNTGWQVPSGPARPPRLYLGLPIWVWAFAWLPVVPTAFMALAAPEFLQPMTDPRASIAGLPPIAMYLVLPLINLAVARVTRNETATLITIAVTSFLGMTLTILGPAAVLILVNLAA